MHIDSHPVSISMAAAAPVLLLLPDGMDRPVIRRASATRKLQHYEYPQTTKIEGALVPWKYSR